MTFTPNPLYRVGLAGGLALLPLLALLAWRPARRQSAGLTAQPWSPGRWAAVPMVAVGSVIAGWAGAVLFVGALALGWTLRDSRLRHPVALGLSAGGLLAAGAVLSRHPWRSVEGYAGHSAAVQLLALSSLAAVAASSLTSRAGADASDAPSG